MNTKHKIIILFAFLTITAYDSYGQVTQQSIDSLESAHQKCLDIGKQMVNCSKVYYLSMDSVLNRIYGQVRYKMSPTGRENLKLSQVNWLKERDAFFRIKDKEFIKKINSGEWGKDDAMIIYDDKAEYVRKRVQYLLNVKIN